jgi:hypothetical protein
MMGAQGQHTVYKQKRMKKFFRNFFKCSDVQLDSLVMGILKLDHSPIRQDFVDNFNKLMSIR